MIALARALRLEDRVPADHVRGARPAAAQDADGPAYADAVSSYAGLDPEGLRAAARAALRARAQVSGEVPPNRTRAHRYRPARGRRTRRRAARVLPPSGAPVSSPRSVSMTGVNGSCAANQRTDPDIWPGGTNALLMNGSS